jgi:quinol monooxygenase YgiN
MEHSKMLKHFVLACLCSLLVACASPLATGPLEPPVTLIINFEATDAGLAEFDEIMLGVPEGMRAEPGFISAKIYRNIESPSSYVLTEVWASQTLHEEHFDRIVASGDWEHINSLLKSAPKMGYYSDRSHSE